MKSFYEMLRILESEQVKTPGGYTLTPEEFEEYENERSPMYKALMLKDIDAKRKREEENRPENIAAREAERRKQEEEKETRRQTEIEELKIKEKEKPTKVKSLREKFDYIIKASGLLLSELPNQVIEGVIASLGIKKENSNWIIKTHAGNFPVDLYSGPMEEPKEDRDYDFIQGLLKLLLIEWKSLAGFDLSTGEWNPLNMDKDNMKFIENIFKKIGAEKTAEIGEKVNFNGIYHDTISDAEVGQEVVVKLPGFIFNTPRGPILLNKSIVEPVQNI